MDELRADFAGGSALSAGGFGADFLAGAAAGTAAFFGFGATGAG